MIEFEWRALDDKSKTSHHFIWPNQSVRENFSLWRFHFHRSIISACWLFDFFDTPPPPAGLCALFSLIDWLTSSD
jgi:hypothetical protein